MQPRYLTDFIGREGEVADLQRLLTASRLVTITGPGGCGKTRLAVQVAATLDGAFADGAHFISLAATSDPTLVIPTVAQALGVGESPGRLRLDSLKEFLSDREMLLLLDNFEQVISAAPLLTELLLAAGDLKMLVTSREGLRLRGERVYPLDPLALFKPETDAESVTVAEVSQYASIRLFVERAQATRPDFELTDENADVVAQICARLDGLPLAIELAAARVSLFPPWAMLARLEESSLGLPAGGPRDLPARQRTLRATVRWSYEMLTPDEQRTFCRLSVFVGGCTLEALTTVSAAVEGDAVSEMAGRPPVPPVLDEVASLVNKNLVQQSESDGEPRLTMLETIGEFGREQLDRSGEHEAVRQAHAAYYLSLAEAAEAHLSGPAQKAWLRRLERERDNFRAALHWGFAQDLPDATAGGAFALQLAAALARFWYLRGDWSEGRRWLEEAAAASDDSAVDKGLRAKVLSRAALLIQHQGDPAHARALCEQSLALNRELDDQEGVLAATLQLCRTMDYQGDYDPLPALIAEGLALADSLPDSSVKAQAYAELALAAASHGTIPLADLEAYLGEGERIYRAADNLVGLAYTIFVRSTIADRRGHEARSLALEEEAERLANDVEDQHLRLGMLARRATFNLRQRNYDAARHSIEQIIEMPLGAERTAIILGMLAVILHRQGLSVWAARVLGLADKLADASRSPIVGRKQFEGSREEVAAVRAEVAAHLGDAAFARALAAGRRMTVNELHAIPHPVREDASASPLFEPLTPRESEVLSLLAEELSNPEIAERLVISRRTVDAHLRAIYGKLNVNSRESAVRVAAEHGLLKE